MIDLFVLLLVFNLVFELVNIDDKVLFNKEIWEIVMFYVFGVVDVLFG